MSAGTGWKTSVLARGYHGTPLIRADTVLVTGRFGSEQSAHGTTYRRKPYQWQPYTGG